MLQTCFGIIDSPVCDPDDMNFAEKLRLALERSRVSQVELARHIGAKQSQVSAWASGKAMPGLDYARKLSDALGLSMDYLFKDELEQAGPALSPEEQQLVAVARSLGADGATQVLARLVGGSSSAAWTPAGERYREPARPPKPAQGGQGNNDAPGAERVD